jgi:hypothetical protein
MYNFDSTTKTIETMFGSVIDPNPRHDFLKMLLTAASSTGYLSGMH